MNAGTTISGVLLLVGIALFVLAEFGLLNVRQTRLQSLAAAGRRRAKLVLEALQETQSYVVGIQIGITLLSLLMAFIVEPTLSEFIGNFVKFLPGKVISILSIVAITFPLFLSCELLPKRLPNTNAERVILALIIPLRAWVFVMKPIIRLFGRNKHTILQTAMSSDPPERNALP